MFKICLPPSKTWEYMALAEILARLPSQRKAFINSASESSNSVTSLHLPLGTRMDFVTQRYQSENLEREKNKYFESMDKVELFAGFQFFF